MTLEILDNKHPKSNELIKKVIHSIVCTFYLVCIALCYALFTTQPGLHYVVLLFAAFLLLMLSVIQIMLQKNNNKIWVGIITIGSTVALLIATFNDAPNDVLMTVGQLITASSFVVSLSLYIFIWKK